MDSSQILRIVYALAVLALVLPTAFYVFRQNNALRNLTIWIVLFAALMWGYHVMVEKPQLDKLPPPAASDATDQPPAAPATPPPENDGPAVRHL